MRKLPIRNIHPKRENRYLTDDGDTGPIRRPLRNATRIDRILIFIFVFIASTLLTGGGYLYLTYEDLNHETETTLAVKTGHLTETHFVPICLAGGIAGVMGYLLLSFLDPYGTVKSEQTRIERKRRRIAYLKKLRAAQKRSVEPKPESEQDK